jgi:hypothetical protein
MGAPALAHLVHAAWGPDGCAVIILVSDAEAADA